MTTRRIYTVSTTLQWESNRLTTLKTVSMFLRAAKTDAEEAGESTEGMANSISELREEVLALTGGAVDIQLDENTFKSTYQILQEISKVWHNLTDVSQANLLELLGGKRNSNVVAALLENFIVAEKALATSADSAGSAMAENEKYLDSINGKISIFKATFEELSGNFIDSELVKSIVDIGTGFLNILNVIAEVFNALGGLKTVLIALVPYFAIFKTEALMSGLTLLTKPITLLIGKLTALPTLTEALGASIMIMIQSMQQGATGAQALSKALAALGISAKGLQVAIVAAGIAIAALIIDKLVLTTEEANEKLEESKAEYQAITDELKSLNDELDTTNDKISELQSKGKLSFTEQEELERLQKINQELKTEIELEQTKQDIANKQRSNDLVDFYTSYTTTRSNLGMDSFGNITLISDAEKIYGLYKNYEAQIASGFLDQANKTSTEISNIVLEIINAIDGISYIENPQTELDEKHNAILESLNKVILSYNIFSGQEGAKGKALDFLTSNPYKDVTQGLTDLGKAGQVTAETLQDDSYDDFINTAIGMKIITDDSAESLAFLASYFNTAGDSAEDSAKAIIELSNSTGVYTNEIKRLASEYNSLTNGNVDYNTRPFVSPEEMRKAYPEFDGEIGTTYSQTVTIGEGEALYTLSITPILEDGTVLSQEALDDYINGLITSDGIDGVLASDKKNLIINIQPGDYDNEYWEALEETLGEIKNRHWELVKLQNSQSQSVNNLADFYNETSKALDSLDKIYADITDGEYFDFGSLFNNEDFTNAFGNLDSYNSFINTIVSNSNDIKACQEAFDILIGEFISSTDAINGLTDSSKDLVISFLEQQGVANASVFINYRLLLQNEELANSLRAVTEETRNTTIAFFEENNVEDAAAIVDAQLAYQKVYLKYATEELKDATYDEIMAIYSEVDACSVNAQALARLAIEKLQVNKNQINTSADIDHLIALANTARASAADLERLSVAKQYFAYADKMVEADLSVLGMDSTKYADMLRGIGREMAKKPLSYDVLDANDFKAGSSASYTGGSATNKAQEAAAKKKKTWFEKQLAEHQHLVAMEKETDAEYFKWLESAYKKAYKEGIIELEDYYKYEEEVFEGKKELFKDHLNDREHEAELLKEHGTQSEKVVKIYEGLIKDIDKELAAARARGLDDNDDYIQELLDQQRGYYDELFDMFKDHLDDIDHEISMRENYEGEAQAIIKLHEKAKLDIEKQIADLRAQGYTDTDEQIQELQSQWHDHDNAIRDMREEAAEDAKDALDELVEYRVDMLKQEIQDEKDALNEKLDNLREFYDNQKEMLQDQYDEEKYLEEQAEKRKSVSDIESELAMLEFDDSAWAQKRKLELREELSTAQKELDDFEEDHALDLTLDAIDEAAESQAKQIEAQMEALDKRLNDPRALYNQALVEIVSGTHDIYREMQDYNNKHGTGNPQDIKDKYENAYKVLEEYEEIFGKSYRGVQLNNSTNYQPDKGSWDTSDISGTNPANKPPASKPAEPSKPTKPSTSNPPSTSTASFTKGSSVMVKTTATHFGSKSGGVKMASYVPGGTYTVMDVSGDQVLIGRNGVATGWVKKSDLNVKGSNNQSNNTTSATPAPSLTKGTTVTIKKSATHFGSKSGGGKMASHVPGGKYTVMNTSGDQVLIGINGVATGWVKRSDIVGYARGTDFAKAGLARVFEEGYEQIFTSADGNKYKLFNNGDKVLNAKATEFLCDFAESGGGIFNKILAQMLYGNLPKLATDSKLMDIHMGDIIIQGNANNRTVSEIRRTQRENIDYILNEFSKLNR